MTDLKPTGGPAFPCDMFDPQGSVSYQHEGMTLRDYFAAKALSGLLANKPTLSKREANATPPAFRDELLKLAHGARHD